MQSVSPLLRFIKSSLIAGGRAIGGFCILHRGAKCTRRQNLNSRRSLGFQSFWYLSFGMPIFAIIRDILKSLYVEYDTTQMLMFQYTSKIVCEAIAP